MCGPVVTVAPMTGGSATGGQHDLSARLAASSSEFAVSALGAMSEGKLSVFLLHAATAVEHLAKAVLAAQHPSLIAVADKENFDSLLHLLGETVPPEKIRTIGAREALKRAGRYAPECSSLVKDGRLGRLILVRDGVVHLADASSATVEEVLVPYLKASEDLREVLGIEREAYWDGFVGLVNHALKENVEQVRLRVQAALTVARTNYDERFGALDDDVRKTFVTVIEESYVPLVPYEQQLGTCPACGTKALITGTLREEFDEDWDHREGVLMGVHLILWFIPTGLLCRACHLELKGREEMGEAGMGAIKQLEVDEREYFGDWSDVDLP